MELVATERGGVLVIRAMGDRIDAASAIQFKDKMRVLTGNSAALELSGLTPTVQKVFRLTRMDSIFVIHHGVPDGFRHAG